MFNILKISFLLIFGFLSSILNAQQKTIDSLKTVIENSTEDSIYIETCVQLSLEYYEYRTDSSIFHLDEALNKGKKNMQNELFLAKKLFRYSFFAKKQSNFILSLNYITNAILIFEKYQLNEQLIQAYIEAGVLYTRQAEYNDAINILFKALDLSTKIENLNFRLNILNNIGNVYYYKREYEEAKKYYTEELNLISTKADTTNKSVASSYADAFNNIGACYYFQEKFDKSLENYYKSLKINEQIQDYQGIMICYSNIAEIYLIQKKFDECFEYYNKALKMAEQSDDKYFIALFNNDLGTVFYTKNNVDSAITHFSKAFIIGQNIGAQRITQASSKQLSDIYKNKGEFELAFEYLTINKQISDSILNEKQIQQFTRLELQYQFEQTQKLREIETEAKLNKQKLLRNLFIFIALLILILAILSYRNYLKKVKLNKELRDKNIQINIQNVEIQTQADSLRIANKEITEKKNEIEKSHKNTQSSISYASKIQKALLPIEEAFKNIFTDYFIFYKPRDIVSGDFYYLKRTENNIILAVADCTGHGVPGAFVSMLGIAFLNEITEKKQNLNAGQILDTLREYVKKSLKQTGNIDDTSDGMDIALCVFNPTKTRIQFAGANSALLIVNEKAKIQKIAPDRQPVSIYLKETPFKNNQIEIQKGDKLFLYSDGYIDQLRGKDQKKFMINEFSLKTIFQTFQN